MRPTTNNPLTTSAPVFPADIQASARFSFTSLAVSTRDDVFLVRTTLIGSSYPLKTSFVCNICIRSSFFTIGLIFLSLQTNLHSSFLPILSLFIVYYHYSFRSSSHTYP